MPKKSTTTSALGLAVMRAQRRDGLEDVDELAKTVDVPAPTIYKVRQGRPAKLHTFVSLIRWIQSPGQSITIDELSRLADETLIPIPQEESDEV